MSGVPESRLRGSRLRGSGPRRRALLGLGALSLLPGCSPIGLANALTPGSGYAVRRGLRWGEGPRGTLDLYEPDGLAPGAPLLVFFYGGGWQSGEKGLYPFVAQPLTTLGVAVAVPDYRIYPGARWPDFVEDGAAALRWLRAGPAAERPVILMGHSAGAFIAAALATDPRWLGAEGRDALRGWIGLAGPYDFRPDEPQYRAIFAAAPGGRATAWPAVVEAMRGAPPMLLLHGLDDGVVSPERSREMAERARLAGVRATLHEYPGVSHDGIVAALAAPVRALGLQRAPVLEEVRKFLGFLLL